MLTLYDYYRSSACYRVRIALQLKGLDYQTKTVHLINNEGEQFGDDYKKINPHCLVPTLLHDVHTLNQSLAIIEYLNELHPAPPFLPIDPLKKAQVRAFALSLASDIHPLNNLRVTKYLTQKLQISEIQKKEWYQHWLSLGLSALEKQLAALNTAKDFCFGNQPTLADICLVPQMYNARRFSCDTSLYPLLKAIDENCRQHEAFIAAEPKEPEIIK